ncbi:MAG: hypothetical protein CL768_03070 [Chloroflexi bacterium]|nr:hypothetical protein [Chloroflexota bacterium]|tara:strand:- start:879 stop:2051 length:1173 start_codon:yes stop_codon:yes gene_type:complete
MRDKLQKIGLVFAGIFLALIICEFLLAVPIYYFVRGTGDTFYSRQHMGWYFFEDPLVGFLSAPNLKKYKKNPLHTFPNAYEKPYYFETDSYGFRNLNELNDNKSSDEIRIFCLGGSTTVGAESPYEFTYPQLLEGLVNDQKINIINAGVGGYRSIHLLKFYQKVIRNFEPDIITIYSGWNDYEDSMFSYWQPKNPHAHVFVTQMRLTQIPFSQFALVWGAGKLYYHFKNFNRVGDSRGANWKEKYISGANDLSWQNEYRENIQELILSAKSDGVIPIIILFPAPYFKDAPPEAKLWANEFLDMARRWDGFLIFMDNIRKIQMDLAQKNQVPLIDVKPRFDLYDNDYKKKFKYFVDRMHLHPEGNRLIAEVMLDPIKKVIQKMKPASIKSS